MPLFASSPILTTTTAVTRKADSLQFVFGTVPKAMSIYVRFIESGTVLVNNGGVVVISITSFPQFVIASNGSVYGASWSTSLSSGVSSTLATGPSIGQQVELLATLGANGVVQIQQSIAGGAISSAAASAAKVLPQAWGDAHLAFGAGGGPIAEAGATAFEGVVVETGVLGFAQMRALAGN